MLSNFGFKITQSPVYNIPNYTIKMKNVSVSNVASAVSQNGWTEVKAAFNYNPTVGGYDMFGLDVPFYWDGVSNIAVEICWSQVTPNYNSSGRLREYVATNGYRYFWTDAAGSSCGEQPSTIRNSKPQCQIEFTPVLSSVWTGNFNTDWFDVSNWTGGVPFKNVNAIIPSGLTNYPIISGVLGEVKNLLIESNASLSTVGTFSIYGDWTNQGNYNAMSGTLIFKLLTSFPNKLNGVNNQSFNNITVENSNGIKFNSGNYNVFGAFSAVGGNIYTNGRLILASNSVGTGRITEIKTGCSFNLSMVDSYGDGWNGGSITVLENGIPIGTYAASGTGSTAVFSITSGNSFDIQYTSGAWENENSYSITNAQGNVIFSDGTNPNTGVVFSSTANCSIINPFIGAVEQKRFLSLNNSGWRELSSPIVSQTLADWQNDGLTMSNFIGSNYPNFGWTSVYTYEENLANGIKENGWLPASNITNPLSFKKGHRIYIGTGNFTTAVKGVINFGNKLVNLDYQNILTSEINANQNQKGWNLIGNPYPCPIDWDAIAIGRKVNIDNSVWVWSADAGNYGVYVGNSGGIGTNGVNKNIASTQAFWVQANTTGASLSFVEKDKVDANTVFVKSFTTNDFIKFSISSGHNNYKDEMLISFLENSTVDYDVSLDAYKLKSPINDAPEIATVSALQKDLSLNRIPLDKELILPIRTTVGVSGIYELKVSNFEISDVNSCLILEDLYLDSLISIEDSIVYSFYQSDTTQVPRFLLHVRPSVLINVSNEACVGEDNGEVNLVLNSENPYFITLNDGVSIDSIEVTNSNFTISNLSPGAYVLSATHPILGCEAYSLDVVIQEALPILIHEDSTISCSTCNANTYSYSASGGTAPYNFYINNETTDSIENVNGEYNIEVVDANGCSMMETIILNNVYSSIDETVSMNVTLYPNPVSAILNIKSVLHTHLFLYNSIGKVIKKINISNSLIEVDVTKYSPGMYWIISEDGAIKEKIEITH